MQLFRFEWGFLINSYWFIFNNDRNKRKFCLWRFDEVEKESTVGVKSTIKINHIRKTLHLLSKVEIHHKAVEKDSEFSLRWGTTSGCDWGVVHLSIFRVHWNAFIDDFLESLPKNSRIERFSFFVENYLKCVICSARFDIKITTLFVFETLQIICSLFIFRMLSRNMQIEELIWIWIEVLFEFSHSVVPLVDELLSRPIERWHNNISD